MHEVPQLKSCNWAWFIHAGPIELDLKMLSLYPIDTMPKKKKKVHKTQTILDYPDVLFEYRYPTLTVPVKSKNINSCIGTNERITFPQVSLSGALHRHCYLMDGFLIEAEFQKSIPFWQRNHYTLKLLFILQILLQVTFCKMTGTPYRRRWMLSM